MNTPCLFDIGCQQANPETEYLSLQMVDSVAKDIALANFYSKTKDRSTSNIRFNKQKLQNIFTSMDVISADIEFDSSNPLMPN